MEIRYLSALSHPLSRFPNLSCHWFATSLHPLSYFLQHLEISLILLALLYVATKNSQNRFGPSLILGLIADFLL